MSADTAPSIRPPRIAWNSLLSWVLAALAGAASFYVVASDLSLLLPRTGLHTPALLLLIPVLALGPALLSGILGRLERLNVIERRENDAVIWRLSRGARVAMFSDIGFNLFFATLISAYGWAAILAEDWKRALAAAVVIALAMTVMGRAFWRAVTGRLTLAIDAERVSGPGLPGGGLSWNQVNRVTLKQKPGARLVGLVLDNRILWIDLEPFAITARRFLTRLEEVAPQVEIDRPTDHLADLAAD